MSIVKILSANNAMDAAGLVRLIMAGDQLAEEELVQRYSRGVSIIIRRWVKNPADVEDLCQETFRIALEKIRRGEIREPEKLSGFISSLARNLAIEHLRNRRETEILNPDEINPAPNQFDELFQQERAKIVRQVISEMNPERDRQILFRFYIAEEDKKKICADLGLTSLHFNRVLSRARQRFKELYKKELGKE